MMKTYKLVALSLVSLCSFPLMAQILSDETKKQINERLNAERQQQRLSIGRPEVDSVALEKKTLQLFTNGQVGYFSFRESNVESLYKDIRSILPPELQKNKLQIYTNGRLIEDLIPAYYKTKKAKLRISLYDVKVQFKKRLREDDHSKEMEAVRLIAAAYQTKLKRLTLKQWSELYNLFRNIDFDEDIAAEELKRQKLKKFTKKLQKKLGKYYDLPQGFDIY